MKAYESRTPRRVSQQNPDHSAGPPSKAPSECPTILAWLGSVRFRRQPIRPTKSSPLHNSIFHIRNQRPRCRCACHPPRRRPSPVCLSQVIRFACHCTFASTQRKIFCFDTILSVINLHLINICRAFVSGSNTEIC